MMRLVLRMQVGGDMLVRVRTLIRWDEAFLGFGNDGDWFDSNAETV
jgi:hypothetical protein